MHHRIKIWCSLLIVFCLFSSSLIQVSANSFSSGYQTDEENEKLLYALDIVKGYIDMSGIESEQFFSLSEGYYIRGNSGTNVFFVLCEDKCIGLLSIAKVNGEYTSSCIFREFPLIDILYENSIPFALLSDNENLYVVQQNREKTIILEASEHKKTVLETYEDDSNSSNEYKILQTTSIERVTPIRSQYCILNVPIVANATSPDTGKGLCWAAAMASIIRYRTGTNLLTALGEYNLLKNDYPPETYGFPIGTILWKNRSFGHHQMQFTQINSGITYDSAKYIIEIQGLPILIDLWSGDEGHSMVISGFETAYGYYFYRIIDSNLSSSVAVQVTNTSGTSLTYVTPSFTYTDWDNTMY